MGLPEQLPNPVEYLKDVRDENQARQQKQLFFKEQFQKMVENGNAEKAVELIYDEAENLNVRLNKEVTPSSLAQYCLEQSRKIEDMENFREAEKLLQEKYGPFTQDED